MTKYTDKLSSENGRRLSGAKRRSSASIALASLKGSINEDKTIVPEELPPREIAWSMFVNDEGYDYHRLEQKRRASKTSWKIENEAYLNQVQNLKEFVKIVEKRNVELLMVSIAFKLFSL